MLVFQVLFIKIETIEKSEFEVTGRGTGSRDQNIENNSNSKVKVSTFPTPMKIFGKLKFKILRTQD